ncbi:uncharacterized protein LOC123533899 [Mercenaria mercenaria]|uniref:uncharacterized protein LOC123533899 n=1 Tax=Mercenaria mercenaria TaxID=6596 RepID=UPI001E1DCFCC|nr:uncharacterized protein LOC123533899 [Mercenaria mercenaria]XP_045171802.1 uncharacterized protein LOC123533899 [Mercenaria mercenaria]XP_045171803.1 uncharacterized protein LOC123533899 [Mercenaria mercenaria]XP_045171805.1 uncharacterized protein LOC123533899 [Mercenaria mercenaria]
MRDSGETITENTRAPPPFKLEREVTLMPNEFRERMSARHKSRKSSAARSEIKVSHSSKPATGKLRYSTENSYMSNNTQDFDASPSSRKETNHVKTVKIPKEQQESMLSPNDSFLNDDNNNQGELKSTSCHIALTGDIKFMLDNAYANYESEGGFTVKTPPQNMQIKDLMIPLDEWNNKDTVQEKKYTVLPSIKHKTSNSSSDDTESVANSNRTSSGFSFNNQLDFFRDRIEQDADFFADFRVNTSKVKATPRQDPLPPIKHGTKESKSSRTSAHKTSKVSNKIFSDRSEKNGHLL